MLKRLRTSRTRASATPLKAVLLGTFALAALIGGCERVMFYSTGRDDEGSTTAASSSSSSSSSSSTGGGSSTGGMPGVTRGALLEAITTCNVELLEAFNLAAEELNAATAQAKNDPAALPKARAAWSSAIDIWQKAEMFQFGPAGPTKMPGGQGLRDNIYSWPLVSRCLVEQNIASKVFENADFGATSLINMRGLAAAEYLLFYTGTDNACSPASSLNTSGAWAAITPDDLAARKIQYASVVSAALAQTARKLVGAWRTDEGNFTAQVLGAGTSGSAYTTEQMALNAVSDGMFYIESHVKDLKLGRPLGLLDCDKATCPEAAESRFALQSRRHLKNNLLGFRMLFNGCDAGKNIGFDDVLIAINASPLSDKMTADVDAAIAAVDALESDDIAQVVATNKASLELVHAAVKRITDSLKTEFVTVLDLEIPQFLEGDND